MPARWARWGIFAWVSVVHVGADVFRDVAQEMQIFLDLIEARNHRGLVIRSLPVPERAVRHTVCSQTIVGR